MLTINRAARNSPRIFLLRSKAICTAVRRQQSVEDPEWATVGEWRTIEKVNAEVGLMMILAMHDFADESQITESVSANVGQVCNVEEAS